MLEYKFDKIIKMGKAHSLHCEDELFVKEYDGFIIAAVFDGCSSGIDSHYASLKHKYILQNIADAHSQCTWLFDGTLTLDFILKGFVSELWKSIRKEKYEIEKEMLSTAVILLISKVTNQYSIVVCGDGVVSINGVDSSVHDANGNAVWYLSTIVGDETNFEEYYDCYCKKYNGIIHDGNELCISTDGVESFMTKFGSHNQELPKQIFFRTTELPEKYHKWTMERLYNVFIKGKFSFMSEDDALTNIDDLSIIKITAFDSDETETN